ncbi:hypothetical protein A5875_003290, partial [Enterococcus sp. 3H8_DIV0648]
LVGYLLFFIGYFVLVYKKKNLERSYNCLLYTSRCV